jgi:transposase-like protein
MDGSAQNSSTGESLRAKRRKWSEEERDRIVRASLQAGTTVEAVARVYGVNASQIYDWRKQHRQRVRKGKRSVLLPVQVEGPPVGPETKQECSVVIEARSVGVSMSGGIDGAIICAVLERLAG